MEKIVEVVVTPAPLPTYTPMPTYTPLPTYTPAPVEVVEVLKEVIVEKIVEVVVTPTTVSIARLYPITITSSATARILFTTFPGVVIWLILRPGKRLPEWMPILFP